jgi:general secretion pathway protein K
MKQASGSNLDSSSREFLGSSIPLCHSCDWPVQARNQEGRDRGNEGSASRWNERGIALILVLLMVAVIVAITIQLNRSTRYEVYEAANLSDGIKMRYVAESGFYAGEAILLADKNSYDALTEIWAKTEMLALKSEELFDGASFSLLIEDEGGKIPINSLAGGGASLIQQVMQRLLTGPDFRLSRDQASEIINAITDWVDENTDVSGTGGAESEYYLGLEKPYEAKNAPLDCIEELLMVKGVTSELFYGSKGKAGMIQYFTAGNGRININTAPKPVLRALSDEMTDDAVMELDEYRRDEKNDLSGKWYDQLGEATEVNISQAVKDEVLTTQSDTFRIRSVGQQGKMVQRITAVVKRDSNRSKIDLLSWKVD